MDTSSQLESSISVEPELNPLVAIPYASGVYSLAFTRGWKWMFTGGEDGFVRKFDFHGSVEGRAQLTVAQRHALADSIHFNGVLCSYWENETPVHNGEPGHISPVYSLAAGSEGRWLLSGHDSGAITLQSLRSCEGAVQWLFQGHTSTVSSLLLQEEEKKFLSASWDSTVREWDLDRGNCKRVFGRMSGQVSAIEYRHESSEVVEVEVMGDNDEEEEEAGGEGSDVDSLFSEEEDEEKNKDKDNEDSEKESSSGKVVVPPAPATRTLSSRDIFLVATIDGTVSVWDGRDGGSVSRPVLELALRPTSGPWCMSACWSTTGTRIFAGRRNCTVDEYDIRSPGKVERTLKFPLGSGPVSCVQPLDEKHLLCASHDNIRLYDLAASSNSSGSSSGNDGDSGGSRVPFTIVPGHSGGMVSALAVDPQGRFVVAASGNRGWAGRHAEYVYVYEKQ